MSRFFVNSSCKRCPIPKRPWPSSAGKIAWAIIALGTTIRLRLYLVNRSLWGDEARLALNLINRSFGQLWQPLDWQQGAPIGFLMLQKAVIVTLGSGEMALRLIPFFAGILSLILFFSLARRLIAPGAGLIALGMMSLSKGLIYYSSEMKQYSTDVLIALLILMLTVRCFDVLNVKQLRSRMLVWGVISALLIWFSHPAVFVVAGTGIALIVAYRRDALFIAVTLSLVAAVSFAIDYFVVLRPLRQSVYLHEFWQQGGFLPRPIGLSSIAWMWRAFFLAFRTPGGFKVPIFTPFVFLLGVAAVVIRKRWLAAVLLLPALITLASAAADEYPYLHRLILFLLPMLFLFTGVGLECLWNMLPGPRGLAIGICAVALFSGAIVATAKEIVSPEPVEEIKPMLGFLQSHRKAEDGIYVYRGAEPALRYYAPRYGIDPANVIMGKGKDEGGFQSEVQLLPRGTVWVLISHVIVESDKSRLLKLLDAKGQRDGEFTAPGAWVYRYEIGGQ
jgi:hypothetical protein